MVLYNLHVCVFEITV